MQKTKSMVVNKTGTVEFTSLNISPGTAAVKWLPIRNLLSLQL